MMLPLQALQALQGAQKQVERLLLSLFDMDAIQISATAEKSVERRSAM